MIKTAIYCRLSDEDKNKKSLQDDSESIQNQKNLLMKYAIEKEWDIYKIYSDDDYSGLDLDRPEFNKMIKDAEERKFDIILCKTQSRFTRDMELVEKYLHNKFIEWGVRFVTVVDGVDTLDKYNKKSRQINGLINEWYSEDISESIKSVFRLKQKSGKFIGSFASFGYLKDEKDKNTLIVDEVAAETVKAIFNLYLQGNGTQRIASILNERKIPNPTKYKQIQGLKYKNASLKDDYGFWNKTTIKRILKNEIYIGNMVQHKRKKVNYKSKKFKNLKPEEWMIVNDTHPAIIDKETFYKVQQKLNSKIRSDGKGEAHIFAGKIVCMDCKNTMNKMSNGKEYVYLRCKLYSVNSKKGLCSSHSIRLNHLQNIVSAKVRKYINELCDAENIGRILSKEHGMNNKLKLLEKQLIEVEKEFNKCCDTLKNLYLDKMKSVITEEEFAEYNKIFLEDKKNISTKKELLENDINNIKNIFSDDEYFKSIVKRYQNFTELNYAMVNDLIDFIEVGEKDKKNGEQVIRIYWNF